MKIGKYDLDEKANIQINTILSNFYDCSCKVIDGEAIGIGKSVNEDKQYRLNINNNRYASVKLKYDESSSHLTELIVNEIRENLHMENYNVERISGFPIDGDKWRQGDCLLIDWGIQNTRVDLNALNSKSLTLEEKDVLFEEIATNGAFAYALGLWDRSNRNFVWDKTNKKILSIDHENFSKLELDREIPAEIAGVMKKFFGMNWYEDIKLIIKFTKMFSRMWDTIVNSKEEIKKTFQKYGYPTTSLIPRIEKGYNIPLSLIMMSAIDM